MNASFFSYRAPRLCSLICCKQHLLRANNTDKLFGHLSIVTLLGKIHFVPGKGWMLFFAVYDDFGYVDFCG